MGVSTGASPQDLDRAEAALRRRTYQKWTNLHDAFRGIDVSNTGTITKSDFQKTLQSMDFCELTDADVELILKLMEKKRERGARFERGIKCTSTAGEPAT